MPASTFEFRRCLSPECGLRYPVQRDSEVGKRCPICLGNTIVVAEVTTRNEPEPRSLPDLMARTLSAVLDNVRSALNVGSILRTAEGYGFGHVYLGGITPTPENRQVRKTGLGAESTLSWSAYKNAVELIGSMKQAGYCILALERTAQSKPIQSLSVQYGDDVRRVLVVGNEQAGVDPGILELADEVLHLEMSGRKQSFNVAVAFAIAAHALTQPTG